MRNEQGLIDGITYHPNADKTINWELMIPNEFIVAKDEANKAKPVGELKPNEKLILLGGFKYLAKLRGFRAVEYQTIFASETKVCLACTINFTGNFETEMKDTYFSSTADASVENTKDFGKAFLTTVAENRAFCRTIRNFLNINILSKEELGGGTTDFKEEAINENAAIDPTLDPRVTLKRVMEKGNFTFDALKSRIVQEGNEGAIKWQNIDDIPTESIFALIGRLKTALEKAGRKVD